ncbi:hypothetical protein [Methylobacterium sp. E-046]|uniref:hypothetical protein n=1 Tax=Methylobacterium sp. E-046 TaxID=2836576 RepID=UPI001FBA851A|nr:hypothetical protein [Methylobacterium sp. E-046]MCJ2100028.1 hypothetical protein [Methylobacterium sp. E-046]
MARPPSPMMLEVGIAAADADSKLAVAGFSPTRRRLFTLMAALPAAQPQYAAEDDPSWLRHRSGLDQTLRLFAEVQGRLAEHERALQACDQLEAALVAKFGYPRVRLTGILGLPDRFAADLETIARLVPPGRRRERLQRVLRRRQARWADAAQACGLTPAQEREDALFRAVRDAADSLYAMPATTLTGLVLKLVVLLSLEEPGEAASAASPWRELRLILLDLSAIATVA